MHAEAQVAGDGDAVFADHGDAGAAVYAEGGGLGHVASVVAMAGEGGGEWMVRPWWSEEGSREVV